MKAYSFTNEILQAIEDFAEKTGKKPTQVKMDNFIFKIIKREMHPLHDDKDGNDWYLYGMKVVIKDKTSTTFELS